MYIPIPQKIVLILSLFLSPSTPRPPLRDRSHPNSSCQLVLSMVYLKTAPLVAPTLSGCLPPSRSWSLNFSRRGLARSDIHGSEIHHTPTSVLLCSNSFLSRSRPGQPNLPQP